MNIGDYVRTKRGTFDRFITSHTQDGLTWYSFEDKGNITNPENYIIKSSPNIIDLIQVGDYVNGNRVIKNCVENKGNIVLFENGHCARNEEIKSIVTKEQFERNEYKI